MFKSLKQKVASDQKVRTPQSKPASEAPNATPPGRSTRPSIQSQHQRRQNSDDKVDAPGKKPQSRDGTNFSATAKDSASKNEHTSADTAQSDALANEKKVPFFKRLEFLTPLKDQMAKGLSESKESISSLMDEMRGNISSPQIDNSRPDVVAQTKERSRVDSMSDVEDFASHQQSIDLSSIPKEQLLAKVIRLEKSLHKYREKYSELSFTLREAKQEREKLHTVMQQTQDKNLRRIQELKEKAELDLKAKMHLEEEFRVSLEEKDQVIHVQQTQIAILKGNSSQSEESPEISPNSPASEDLQRKLNQLEEQLKFAKDTCQGFKSQGEALQGQLDERLEEMENMKTSNMSEKSKLIKQLREAKNVIEQIEEDKQTAVAEAKRQMHEILEGKDQELETLHDKINSLKVDLDDVKAQKETMEQDLQQKLENAISAGKATEATKTLVTDKIKHLDRDYEDRLNKIETDFDSERKQFVSQISHLKADELRLNELIKNLKKKHENAIHAQLQSQQVALEEQSNKFQAEMLEKENQMRLAIEERELNKMAAVSKQDAEAQSLLEELGNQLEAAKHQVEVLEKAKVEEADKHRKEIVALEKELLDMNATHNTQMQNLLNSHDEHLSVKAEEFLKKYTSQNKNFEDKLSSTESTWVKKLEEVQSNFLKEKQFLQSQVEELKEEKQTAVTDSNRKISSVESQLNALIEQKDTFHIEISDLKLELNQKNAEVLTIKQEFEGKQSELLNMQQELKNQMKAKDTELSILSEQNERLAKEIQAKENSVLQKSENSKTKLEELHQNLITLQEEKAQMENELAAIKKKLKEREGLMKKHILEAEAKHKDALTTQSDEFEVEKQGYIMQIANLEKSKLEAQKLAEQTQKKFMEAGGRLKGLAQKYKATVAEHEAVVKKSKSDLSHEQEKCKSLEERIVKLDQEMVNAQNDMQQKLQKMRSDFDQEQNSQLNALTESLVQEKNALKTAHQKEIETVTATITSKLNEEKDSVISAMTQSFDATKKQLLVDAEKKLEQETKNAEIQFLTRTSDAQQIENSLRQSCNEISEKLNVAREKNGNLEISLNTLQQRIADMQQQLDEKEVLLASLTQENQSTSSKLEEANNRLESAQSEIAKKIQELEINQSNLKCLNEQMAKVVEEKVLVEANLSTKASDLNEAISTIDRKSSELETLKSELAQQCSNAEEFSQKILELNNEIAKFEGRVTEESFKLKKTSDEHTNVIEQLNQDWQEKYAELQGRTEHDISQLLQQLKFVEAEVSTQRDVIQNLEKEKSDFLDQIETSNKCIEDLEQRNQELVDLKKQFSILKNEYTELEKLSDDNKSQTLASKELDVQKITELTNELKTKETFYTESQIAVEQSKFELSKTKDECQRLLDKIQEQEVELTKNSENAREQMEEFNRLQESIASVQHLRAERESEIECLKEKLSLSETQLINLSQEHESLKNTELEQRSLLQLGHAQNEEMAKSLENLRKEIADKEASFNNELLSMKDLCQQKIKEETSRLEGTSDKKVTDFKKKAEVRLGQIKKTFTTQLEEKLKIISVLEEEKKTLDEKLEQLNSDLMKTAAEKDSEYQVLLEDKINAIDVLEKSERKLQNQLQELNNEKDNAISKKDSEIATMQEDVEQLKKIINDLNEEKENAEKLIMSEKEAYERTLRQESELRIQNLLEEEELKYQEGQQQLSEVKDHLEQVLQEARLKLEETEKKMDEEKDRADLALQEEKDKRMQSEIKLSVLQEDFSAAENMHGQKLEELASQNLALKNQLQGQEEEVLKAKQEALDRESSLSNQLNSARKRNEKLEKDRETIKERMKEETEEYERRILSLKDEISSTQKQVEVLSKTAVEDNEIEVERKLESLKEDFEKRLKDKDDEMSQKLKRLMVEYETQIQQNDQSAEQKMDKLSQKNLALQDSMRSDHHKELVFLQREIQSKEKEIEDIEQKYGTEMHEMETNMSEQVDKAMYRAMVAEKKLQESEYEIENQKLQMQLTELNKSLSETQQKERESSSLAQSLEARMSTFTSLADPDKLEYLRRILYSYIMGSEQKTMAKVLILLLQYNELDSQQILEKHGISGS